MQEHRTDPDHNPIYKGDRIMATGHSTSSAPHAFFAQKDEPYRRRLASNVLCMFDEDRPAVVQVRRRGRLPKAVASLRVERHRRYLDSLPKPYPYEIGDIVEVKCEDGEWIPAIIVQRLATAQDGMKKFKLFGYRRFFRFRNSLEQYCDAWEVVMRPA